jgi:hypothetical protein
MRRSPLLLAARLGAIGFLAACATGCTVIAVTGAAVGAATTAAGLAVDATVGAVKITGAAVGAAADLVIPDGDEKK